MFILLGLLIKGQPLHKVLLHHIKQVRNFLFFEKGISFSNCARKNVPCFLISWVHILIMISASYRNKLLHNNIKYSWVHTWFQIDNSKLVTNCIPEIGFSGMYVPRIKLKKLDLIANYHCFSYFIHFLVIFDDFSNFYNT